MWFSDGQLNDALTLLNRDEVVVKEVAVEARLQSATEDLSPAEESVDLIPVNPVKDVEEPVQAQGRDIMRGDVLDDPNFVQHPDLRDEGNRLEPQTETPGHLPRRPAGVDNACGYDGGRQKRQ